MPQDLPAEIWLHIASLLPKSQIHKLAGINRMLFSLAMDKIYREVWFMDDGEDMLKTLQQLNIALRVKHVYIRPTLFPIMVEPDPDPDPEVAFLGRVKSKMSHLRRRAFKRREDFLSVAQRALANCKASEGLTIVLNDTLLPASFDVFLNTIWSSLGPNIRQLTLDATPAKVPLILNYGKLGLPNLTDLRIGLTTSRFSMTPKHISLALRVLRRFITPLNLESLTISSFGFDGSGFLLVVQRDFPRLQNLALPIGTGYLDYANSLTHFLARHKTTLQRLTLAPPTITTAENESVYSHQQYATREFCELELPVLQSLHITVLSERRFSYMFVLPLSSVKLCWVHT